MEPFKLLSIMLIAAVLVIPGGMAMATHPNNTPTNGDDYLHGNNGPNKINGQAGNDLIEGFGGKDDLKGGNNSDTIFGGDGDDKIQGGAGNDEVFGDDGDDVIDGGTDNDRVYGNDGDDNLDGGTGNDVVEGGAGNDSVKGGAGNDYVAGGDGNDIVTGSGGDDIVEGGAGQDLIFAGDGEDTLYGGEGSDKLVGGLGPDSFDGGNGGETETNDNGDFMGDLCIWDGGPGTIWVLDTIELEGEDADPVNCEILVEEDPRLSGGGAPPSGGKGKKGGQEDAPGAIDDLSAIATALAEITLTWSAPSPGDSAIDDYIIEVSTDGGATFTTFSDGESPTTGFVDTAAVNGVENTYRVSAVSDVGQGSFSNESSATPGVADLRLTKTVNDSTPTEGDTITFTITITNDGPIDTTNVDVSDTLPAGFSADIPSQGSFAGSTWDVGTLTNGQSETLTISGPAGIAGNVVTNTAEVSASDEIDPDSIPNNNQAAEDDQDSDSATAQVAVIDELLSLDSITITGQGGKDKKNDIIFTFAVSGESAQPVAGAEITIDITLDGSPTTITVTTGAEGTATFKESKAANGSWDVDLSSLSVVAPAGFVWDTVLPADPDPLVKP